MKCYVCGKKKKSFIAGILMRGGKRFNFCSDRCEYKYMIKNKKYYEKNFPDLLELVKEEMRKKMGEKRRKVVYHLKTVKEKAQLSRGVKIGKLSKKEIDNKILKMLKHLFNKYKLGASFGVVAMGTNITENVAKKHLKRLAKEGIIQEIEDKYADKGTGFRWINK